MATTTNVVTDRTIEVPRGTYSLQYSPRLVITGEDFYHTLKVAAEMAVAAGKPITPPDAGEEHQLYVQKSVGAKKLRDVEELKDYFGENDEGWYARGWTLTGLRVPEEYVGRKCEIGEKVPVQVIITDITPYLSQIADPQFTIDNWKDIIGNVNKVVSELTVPYSEGHVIREMHPTLGIFTEVEETTEYKAPYVLRGWLREDLDVPKDPISGYHDLAVVRRCNWRHDGAWCLGVGLSEDPSWSVNADYRRWGAFLQAESIMDSSVGFRPVVRGSSP